MNRIRAVLLAFFAGTIIAASWFFISVPTRRSPAASPAAASTAADTTLHHAGSTGVDDTKPTELDALRARLLVEQVRFQLLQAYRHAATRADFAMTPGRVLDSLLARRCSGLREHQAALAAAHVPGLDEPGDPCRNLLLATLKEQGIVPATLSADELGRRLAQVDVAFRTQVTDADRDPHTLGARMERFRQQRRTLVGAATDARLFGLADEIGDLPGRTAALGADPKLGVEEKLSAFKTLLGEIEHKTGTPLASVMEPLELARLELDLRETGGSPLDEAQRQAVLARYLGDDTAKHYLAHQQEQSEREARLSAFNAEREQMLAELRRQGLTEAAVRARMPEIDRSLFRKYHFNQEGEP